MTDFLKLVSSLARRPQIFANRLKQIYCKFGLFFGNSLALEPVKNVIFELHLEKPAGSLHRDRMILKCLLGDPRELRKSIRLTQFDWNCRRSVGLFKKFYCRRLMDFLPRLSEPKFLAVYCCRLYVLCLEKVMTNGQMVESLKNNATKYISECSSKCDSQKFVHANLKKFPKSKQQLLMEHGILKMNFLSQHRFSSPKAFSRMTGRKSKRNNSIFSVTSNHSNMQYFTHTSNKRQKEQPKRSLKSPNLAWAQSMKKITLDNMLNKHDKINQRLF